ncbi:hypothetical protein SAMD00019534_079620 [Acytostelium subglobosum LB1]|uniref:hypothetical protein n=1 Tax=Acytostelium subglobosum LB1 TaxID=1410327 RepID=UPI0006452336|nr:hypothetical protein SAMD00019534_079620 [Acytostelium subglobosum LB1]GAM24787.1 hypothetical protein SAMD00019534_079620 [Acytostelium subglobosum LB1]|eukprot:XP_012752456.1 hypothetical protein SAMD00019534_079620 [Acytostelium subglobosum LB1]
MPATATNLGFPRMGENRELKKLVETYWEGKLDVHELLAQSKELRAIHWKLQRDAGITLIPSNDFSFYDQILDHLLLFGAIPPRYKVVVDSEPALTAKDDPAIHGLKTYFAMGRGYQTAKAAAEASSSTAGTAFGSAHVDCNTKIDVSSMEMKKWFDTNYHNIVPEFAHDQQFALAPHPKPLREYLEAKQLGIETRPVLLGPLTFLLLGKSGDHATPYKTRFDSIVHLDKLLPLYEQLAQQLAAAGVQHIQFDEPILCLDLIKDSEVHREQLLKALETSYNRIRQACPSIKLQLTTYFGELRENFALLKTLPINSLHIDCVRGTHDQVLSIAKDLPATWSLSIGVIDGRNIWKSDYKAKVAIIKEVVAVLGNDRVLIGPSCSLLHSPHSLKREAGKVRTEVLDWLAFAVEKLDEIVFLTAATNAEFDLAKDANLLAKYEANQASIQRRSVSPLIHNDAVKQRVANLTPDMFTRSTKYPQRRIAQRARLTTLPDLFPTTTIGSFPQTREVRLARNQLKSGKMTQSAYDEFINEETKKCIQFQEQCGLDILVHGEFERTDMVEYFGEHLDGYVFTSFGWVQSYGSRCVKPPIIFGDVSRPHPMTVAYSTYAQSLTKLPMKGMLTGPVTILQWSFVRDDQPRSQTCFQIGLAIRDEVLDLERAGIACIQIDEAAVREGLPLRIADWDDYFRWAIDSFLLASCGVRDDTQIHSHMCYSDFNDMFTSIQRMDADVLTIENSKSDLKLLRAFEQYGYANEIGPGLYDIHSPRIPTVDEMSERVQQMLKYIPLELIWVNPDCGLKTRGWNETKAALANMVEVAKQLRAKYQQK